MRWSTVTGPAALVVAAALLTGCTSTGPQDTVATSTVTATPSTTVASAAPTDGPTGTPTPAGGTATPATPATTSAAASARGCPATGGAIPAGAQVETVNDVDGDGTRDQEFIAGNTFGVRTHSGAVITFDAGLAGGGDRHAWISTMEAEPPMAVMDDGRGAVTEALVHCRFVAPVSTNGKPYAFLLFGYGEHGTGVTCAGSDRGGYELAGVDAVKVNGGRYRIDTTEVGVSDSGTTARNGRTVRGTTTYAAGSRAVTDARRSFCKLVPLLDSSGE